MNRRIEYRIYGMDCAEEVSLLRRHLSELQGVYDLSFDIFQGKMSVEFNPGMVNAAQIQDAVASIGMRCAPWSVVPSEESSFWRRNLRKILAASGGVLLLSGIIHEGLETGSFLTALLAHGHVGPGGHQHPADPLEIALFLASISCSIYFVVPKALLSLLRLRPDMNALVLFSAAGAGFLGLWIEAATLAFLFSVSGLLETWSITRARKAITSLMHITPQEATVVHDHGEHTRPVSGISVGASVRIRPGERIPCDGIVVEGESYVNQALVTGESVPVRKKCGDVIYAGTLNEEGELLIRTTRAASDTILARVLRMVESSEHRRAPSERFIDRFALYYTPAMFVLAAAIGVVPPLFFNGGWTYWFYQAMMILLISCPCALVISTPVSLVAALASAARQGILIKGAAFLEESAQLRAMLFDKSGMLTPGEQDILESLRRAGIGKQVLMTGENSRAGAAFGGGIGMDAVRAGMQPEEKAALVKRLVEEYRHVAVVGDVVRDVRPSTFAAIGIAMGPGAPDTAQENADVVIMSGDLRKLFFLLRHSRRAMAVVRQNVILALTLKIIFLAMSLLGMATLWMAIAADTGATLLVTFNGLRLLRPRNVVTDSAK